MASKTPPISNAPSAVSTPKVSNQICETGGTIEGIQGTIVVSGDYEISVPPHRGPSFVWNVMDNKKLPLNLINGEFLRDFSMSLDGRWLAVFAPYENSAGGQLFILDRNGNVKDEFSDSGWWGVAGWINERQILVPQFSNNNPFSSLILDPFSKESQVMLPSYPTIYKGYPWVFWGSYASAETVYSPNLNLVIYPRTHSDFILWDRKSQTSLKEIHSGSPTSSAPLWSRNGKEFIIDLSVGPDWTPSSSIYQEELFSIDINGSERRLTHLVDDYEQIEIQYYSWSSDERYIAFWFRRAIVSENKFQLGILDLATGITKTYCIYTVPQVYAPVWSPNANQLLVAGFLDNPENYGTVFVDLERNYLSQIEKEVIPIGWMSTKP